MTTLGVLAVIVSTRGRGLAAGSPDRRGSERDKISLSMRDVRGSDDALGGPERFRFDLGPVEQRESLVLNGPADDLVLLLNPNRPPTREVVDWINDLVFPQSEDVCPLCGGSGVHHPEAPSA